MEKENLKDLDFYGDDINYIHAKFGDLRKCYNFTDEFMKRYPRFSDEYIKYFMGEESLFSNPYEIVNYIITFDIPVYGYYNFTDTIAKDWQEVKKYLDREYRGNRELYQVKFNESLGIYCYYSLDGDIEKMEIKTDDTRH